MVTRRRPRDLNTCLQLAKEVVSAEEDHEFHRLVSGLKRPNQDRIFEEWRKEWCSTGKGKYLRKIDGGLPSKRAQWLYGPLPRSRAYSLTQLRIGHSWLANVCKAF